MSSTNSKMTAAQLAEVMDPQHEIDDWWHYSCPECGETHGGHSHFCFHLPEYEFQYYGPPDLHTARQHAWRMEVWLEARGVSWFRNKRLTVLQDENDRQIHTAANHSAALLEAVEKIAKGNKE